MSSTGLSSGAASMLAYSGWWITGALMWYLARRDPAARFHAAQATVAFGAVAALIALFGGLAIASLSFVPATFMLFITLAAATWVGGVALWGVAMWKARRGDEWRIPVAADWAARLTRASAAASS